MTIDVRIDGRLTGTVRLGVISLVDMRLPDDDGEALWARVEQLSEELAGKFAGLTAGQIPEVQETRRLYRSIGLDPTKTRPSSEALLRRIIKGKGLYRIHPLVDLFNLVSVEAQLSVGLYDSRKIDGDEVVVALGKEGWGFDGIRKGRINVEGRLCVVDSTGPFGSPTADSLRTSIGGNIPEAMAIFFQPLDGDPSRLEAALDRVEELASVFMSARTGARTLIE